MTRLEALLRLWRDADELRTVVDHCQHLITKLDHARRLVTTYRERLTRAELIEISQGAYIAELQAELAEAHDECVRLGRLLHPSRRNE